MCKCSLKYIFCKINEAIFDLGDVSLILNPFVLRMKTSDICYGSEVGYPTCVFGL